MADADAPSRLPIIRTVSQSFELFIERAAPFARATAPWAIILFGLILAMPAWAQPIRETSDGNSFPVAPFIAAFAMTAVTAFVTIGAACAWHRTLMLGESRSGLAVVTGAAFWIYAARWTGLLIAFLIVASSLLSIGTVLAVSLAPISLLFLLATVASAAILLVAARLSLVLPAAAIRETRMTFLASWQFTRGSGWRLFLGGLLAVAPAVGLSLLVIPRILPLTPELEWDAYRVLAIAARVATYFVTVGLATTYLSVCYHHLVRRTWPLPGEDTASTSGT
jgi:hypothetical protein